ncbi:hypothetical protein [Nafulsella turpanensis]|uniref:hypothetical protein n=1 Tax=Nafulsella turpanensis TaxID=1265690 RepID=UPI0003452558|nr:hypothetical protein [Nafulsella turpanensis]
MKHFLLLLSLFAGTLFSTGCASSYHSTHPPSNYFNSTENTDELAFSYRYDVLREKGNKKYAKKEDKKGLRVVAVKITNNTERPLFFPEDFEITSGHQSVYLLEPDYIHSKLKQGVPIYLLYLLLTPMKLYTSNNTGDVTTTEIGYVLGPGITALNMGMAANANNKFKRELLEYNLANQVIEVGETVYGIIGFQSIGYAPLKLKLKNE